MTEIEMVMIICPFPFKLNYVSNNINLMTLDEVNTMIYQPQRSDWAEMGVAYLEINKLPCLHEIDIPKCINVYSIYRTKLGVTGFFVLSFLICF